MIDFLFKLEISILAQVAIFVILITSYHLLQRKLPTYHLLGLASLRTFAFILVFFFLTMTYSSEINPTMRTIYVLLMSITNIYLIWQVIQSFRALRRANIELKKSGQDSQNQSKK